MKLWLIAIVAAIVGFTITAIVAKLWQTRDDTPTPVRTREMPLAEDVGKKAGSATAGFGKGFVEGVKDRLKAKP